MKILLLGKKGLLGRALFEAFSGETELAALSHDECDISNPVEIEEAISISKPDFILNATGYTNVDKAESERDLAFQVNSKGVENLAIAAKKHNAVLVHFSTDYVFSGENSAGYYEDAVPSPLSVYGASKASGEQAILQILGKFYIVRTAWLYGPGGKNFVDTMLQLAKNEGPLRVVNDQVGSPTFAPDLAQAILKLTNSKNAYGVYHIVNDGVGSWYEFAAEIYNQLGVPKQIIPITSDELARPARRPKFSVLLSRKFDKLRHWKQALTEYLKDKTLIL